MKFRKLISLLMVIAMVLSVVAMAGCGEKKPTGSQTGGERGSSEEDFFLDMPNELRGTKVQFATWIDHNSTDTAAVLRAFEQETGMKSEIVAVPQGSYVPKLNTLIAADEAPDVIVDNGDFPQTLRLLAPLSFEENAIDPKDPFWDQQITDIYTIGKHSYLVIAANCTFNMGGSVVYFNRTMLEENGIKTPTELIEEDNWNLDSFVELMRQAKQRYSPDKEVGAINIHSLFDMMGTAEIKFDKENDVLVNGLKDSEALTALQWAIKLKDEGIASVFMEAGGGDVASGAIVLTGAYGLRNKPGWYYDMNLDDLGVAKAPKINKDDAEYPATGSNRAYGICKGAKNPKGAGYFLRFFLNGDNYDYDEVYKNEECKNLYIEIRSYQDRDDLDYQAGCRKIVNPDSGNVYGGMMYDLCFKTSYAQIGTVLAATQNTVDAAVAKGNEIINEVKNAQ